MNCQRDSYLGPQGWIFAGVPQVFLVVSNTSVLKDSIDAKLNSKRQVGKNLRMICIKSAKLLKISYG